MYTYIYIYIYILYIGIGILYCTLPPKGARDKGAQHGHPPDALALRPSLPTCM